MTSILYALNETYDHADRRAETTVLPGLPILPHDFLTWFKYVLEGPFDKAGAVERARLFKELADEVIEMAAGQTG